MLPKWIIIFSVALAILGYGDSSSARFLVWDADGNANSGPAIETALSAAAYEGDYTTNINPYLDSLSNYCIIFICLGVYDSTYVLVPGIIVDSLAAYLDGGGNIYMEGGDTWAYDTPTALHGYFYIDGLEDGLGDVDTILGQPGSWAEGGTLAYYGDNQYMDRLDTLGNAYVVFANNSPAYNNGICYEAGPGLYKTVGTSFEFGGLEDGVPPSTRADLAYTIMGFFGCLPAIYNLNVGVTSITNPGSWTLPNTPLIPQAQVKNLGTDTVTFDVICFIDSLGDTIYTDTQPVTDLISDSTRQVNFISWTPAGVGNCYNVTVHTDLAGDQMPANDTLDMTACVFDTTWDIVSEYTSNPPIIDGFMAPGEWTDATRRDVSNIFDNTLNNPGCVYFYVKNDTDNIYIAVDAVSDSTEEDYDLIWTYFDDNNDGAWPVWPLPIEGDFSIANKGSGDSVYFSALNWDSCNAWPPCSLDRADFATINSGHMQYEWAFPLILVEEIPPPPDQGCYHFAAIQASACDTVGFWLAVLNQNPSPTWIGWWPTNAESPEGWACAPGRMGRLILGCPPNQYDGSVFSLDAPPDTVCLDSTYDVKATVKNVGYATLDSIEAVCTIDTAGGNVYTEYGTILNLGRGEDTLVPFIPWTVPSSVPSDSLFTMTVTITATGDTLTGNNSLSKTLYICTVGIEERLTGSRSPKVFALSQNRPNPFSLSTTITYALPKRSAVSIKVFDIAGNEVRTLVSDLLEPGFYSMSWDGRDTRGDQTASGVYFLRMEAGTFRSVRKMVMLN